MASGSRPRTNDSEPIPSKRRCHNQKSPLAQAIGYRPDDTEMSEIEKLNDDCLLEIFDYLSIPDLFEVQHCCSRFNILAEATMLRKCAANTFHYIWKNRKHERILERYGAHMEDIVFESGTNQRVHLLRYNTPTWLRECKSLKKLTIQNLPLIYDAYSNDTYNRLESLTIDNCHGAEETFKSVIMACKNLKSIAVRKGTLRLDWIGAFEDLENISIRLVSPLDGFLICRFADELLRLTKLKYFFIDIPENEYFVPIIMALPRTIPLEHLVLGLKKGVTRYRYGFADTLDKIEALQLCQIRYYSEHNTDSELTKAKSLVESIRGFHVNINYHDVKTDSAADNYFDIKLQRKS